MVASEPAKNQSAFASDTQNRSPFVIHIGSAFQQPFAL
jgi:hypothetical protein